MIRAHTHALLFLSICYILLTQHAASSSPLCLYTPRGSLEKPQCVSITDMLAQINTANMKATIQQLVAFGTRNSLSTTTDPQRGVGAARSWIKSMFEKYSAASWDRMTVEYDTFTAKGGRLPQDVEMRNVIATLPGDDDPQRIIIVSGHYDSRASDGNDGKTDAPGADDNASAIALVLELARVMASYEFQATIKFVAFCGEEQGLFGSTNLASVAQTNGWNIIAVLNNDIVGSSGPGSQTNLTDDVHVRLFSKPGDVVGFENDSVMRQLARYTKEVSLRYVDNLVPLVMTRQDRYLRGGDQNPFVANKLSAIRVTEMNENFDHQHQNVRVENGTQYGDLEMYIDYNYLTKVASMNMATIANLGLAPGAPENVTLANKSELSNFSVLKWMPSAYSTYLNGYYVRTRLSYENEWSDRIFTTDTSITLPNSKDNYLFAVQAVDAAGHESLPVIAV